ncbi:MAG: MmgE/PrpD family protein, partial [Rudaea sp.]
GSQTPMARISADWGYEQFAPGGCTVIGSNRPLGEIGAAWINGTYASALDLDDGNRMAMGHPGANVIPAALAVAERSGASGAQFLTSLVAGYELAVRTSAARVPWYKDKLYSTGIWGVFGATAAAGKLLGLDDAALQSALGTAGSHGPFPPGGLQANHAMVKEVIAWSGMTGVSSALLARRGFIGPADFFDYTDRWDTSALVKGLGERYAILDTYFKPHAVCRWAHPSVDAVFALKQEHGLSPEEIEAIQVDTFWEVTRLVNYAPSNTIAAQFSIPFALALAMNYDRIGPQEVSEENLKRPAVVDLAQKVQVSVDDNFNRQFPAKTMARVTVKARGTDYQATVEYPRGNAENPLSDEEISDKFRNLACERLGTGRCEKLRAAILDLPHASDVSTVTRLLAS